MNPVLNTVAVAFPVLQDREAVMQAMDGLEAIYEALDESERDAANNIMSQLQARLDSME
jgi:hypothetical protein